MGWLITRAPTGGFTRVFAHGLGLPLMDVVLDLAKINQLGQSVKHPEKKLALSEIRRQKTIARNERIRSLAAQDLTIAEISRRFDLSETTVYQIIVRGRKRDAKARGEKLRRGSFMTDENKQRREEMRVLRFEKGMTIQEIGDLYHLSRERVRQIIGNSGKQAFEKRDNARKTIASETLDKTNEEIIEQYDLFNEGNISRYRAKYRHTLKPGTNIALGMQWENWVSEQLQKNNIPHELMTNFHPYDILAFGKVKIDIKSSRIRTDTMPSQRGCEAYQFNIRSLEKKSETDFFVFVITPYEVAFIVPSSELSEKSLSLRIPWPPKGKKMSRWHKYQARWDLLEKFSKGETYILEDNLHGQASNYTKGCRCDLCRAAYTDYQRERRHKQGAKPRQRTTFSHGTANGYSNYGCRCELCKQAQREYYQANKAKRKPTP